MAASSLGADTTSTQSVPNATTIREAPSAWWTPNNSSSTATDAASANKTAFIYQLWSPYDEQTVRLIKREIKKHDLSEENFSMWNLASTTLEVILLQAKARRIISIGNFYLQNELPDHLKKDFIYLPEPYKRFPDDTASILLREEVFEELFKFRVVDGKAATQLSAEQDFARVVLPPSKAAKKTIAQPKVVPKVSVLHYFSAKKEA